MDLMVTEKAAHTSEIMKRDCVNVLHATVTHVSSRAWCWQHQGHGLDCQGGKKTEKLYTLSSL